MTLLKTSSTEPLSQLVERHGFFDQYRPFRLLNDMGALAFGPTSMNLAMFLTK